LILLARAHLIELLRVAGEVVIPTAVAQEIRQRDHADPTVQALDSNPWLVIVDSGEVPPLVQAWDLGPGESAVLAWGCHHAGAEVIVDDLAARRCAAVMGIPTRGTLGLVLVARKRGLIAAARPAVNQLRQAGMYLSDRVVDQALTLVGE
jgi:predicted nucleic acid-binding protein